MNRRTFLTLSGLGLMATRPANTLAQSPEATAAASPISSERPSPRGLDGGVTALDYRVVPDANERRVLLEIRNDSDQLIDTPAIGLLFPGAPSAEDYAWATPNAPVLRPGDTTFALGNLPPSISTNEHLDSAEIMLCSPAASGHMSTESQGYDYAIEVTEQAAYPTGKHFMVGVTNNGPMPPRWVFLYGTVRDSRGRVTGGTPSIAIAGTPTGERWDYNLWVVSEQTYIASPFKLMAPDEDFTVEFLPGPIGAQRQYQCLPVLPWNRDDTD